MKLVKIIKINPLDEPKIVSDAIACNLDYNPTETMFGLYINNEIVSIASVEDMKYTIVIKFEYTKPEHRRNGYALRLLKYCLEYCRATTEKKIVASCMPSSLNIHLSQGAQIIRKCKNGGAMIFYPKQKQNENI